MKAPPLPLWRMTRVRYDRLVDVGIFGPEDRVELLDGLLVAREPQGRRHAAVVVLVRAALAQAFGSAYHVREEKPVASPCPTPSSCRASRETTWTLIRPGRP